ncbi:Hydrocephalus-inducing protein [Papilio xuthus]|uniref:Hydrocephalus-inducing protein n=1 Tax=Papilio xuthus TaxID=66420 RepID=A0A194PP09_PAPXU|nr:Hydrocephalus-inducing protein [Papilio xuthus]
MEILRKYKQNGYFTPELFHLLDKKRVVDGTEETPTYLKMVFKESSYFSVKLNRDQPVSRLAPGMNIAYVVTFVPTQMEDYVHRVVFYTDRDQYVLPIIGFPFSVEPKSAYLNCDEKIEIKVTFKTMHLGKVEGTLRVMFETGRARWGYRPGRLTEGGAASARINYKGAPVSPGASEKLKPVLMLFVLGEIFKIALSGTAHTVNVLLEKQIVRFPDTYNGMVRQQTFKITNKSDYVLTYVCMKNESVYYDFKDKIKLATVFYNMKESEAAKCAKLVRYDVLSSTEHDRVYTRIFYDEIQALVADETLLFQNTHFSMSPIKGQLWPNKTTEIDITFAPKHIGDLDALVYLDIDGVSDRVMLKLTGTSLPPTIHLNLETLDMSSVYINILYNYEIIAINKGHINGVIAYKDVVTLFGSKITCTPEYRCLRPGEKDIFVVSFFNSNPGPFFEEINFVIRDTDVKLKVYLKGTVIYPSIKFSVPSLDFGDVSLGVPKTLSLDIINESNVLVSGTVSIPSDGLEIRSITLTDYAVNDIPKPELPTTPQEFKIEPRKIIIDPESIFTVKITLTANLIRINNTSFELEFEKSDKRPIVLPVTYNAMVPQITPAPDLHLRACFRGFPYVNDVNIQSNNFLGYFVVEEPEESIFDVKIDLKEGYIEPISTTCFKLTTTATALGSHEFPLRLRLFGVPDPIQICYVSGYGVSPIVTCSPTFLHWGQVKLLKKSQKTLILCNDSPVEVNYKTSWFNRECKWQIEPEEGVVEAESEINLTVSLTLVDAETYNNKVIIQLEDMKDILVPVTVTGVGTSIVIGDLGDRIELGHHFTRIPLNCKIMMENRGTRLHALEWSEHYKTPKNKQQAVAFFNLEPRSFKMNAGEQLDLTITGLSHKVTVVKEIWYLVGSIEGVNKKELLLECKITAEFVDPKIEISTPSMDFQYDNGPYNEYYRLTDILIIKNVSTLPLDLEITIKPPFALIQKQSSYKIIPGEEDLCHCITYTESDLKLCKITADNSREETAKLIDFLTLQPVYPLRQGSLQFFEDIHKIKRIFNLTHIIEEHLEDQEMMKVQALFDTTKHTSLKARIYSDAIKIKFKGHKNKDSVKVVGKINFPNILVLTPRIDFQCLLNDYIEASLSSAYLPYQAELLSYEVNNTNSSIATTIQTEPEPKLNMKLKDKLMKTVLPMLDDQFEPKFKWLHKFPETNEVEGDLINSLLILIPHRGKLKPNEVQYINVMFRPRINMNVRAVIECQVLGGPTEYITVTGQSSYLMYTLSTTKINMKIRSFHENAFEYLRIINKALLPFEFKTYLNEPKFENDLYGTILDIVPADKLLQSEETTDIKVFTRPGVLGYFKRQFLLEIGHLPVIPIKVYGWGVIPQVYLTIPRPFLSEADPELGYFAVAMLTDAYLESLNAMFKKPTSEHLNSPLIERCFEDPIFTQDWHLCSTLDAYPSIMDIEMAIERILVMNYLRLHPEILVAHSSSSKTRPIAGFNTVPYVIDYGVVITGCSVDYTIEVFNYGPLVTKLHLSKNTVVPDFLILKLCGKLSPGEVGYIDITFNSDSENFPEPEQNVEVSINLEVPYGVTIPVKFKALCAVPYLVTSIQSIDFGSVKCGHKVIYSIPLKNVGKPVCIWYATLKLKTSGINPITILDSSAKYEPGESGWFSIAFKPTVEMTFEGLIIFRFHMNPKRMTIPFIGNGVMPQVHVIGPSISFPPTLPWAETTEHFFGLTNPCPFPIELIIAHSDTKWREEEEVYQMLERYYNKPDEMLVPAMKPGAELPWEIINFYKKVKEHVKKKIKSPKKTPRSHEPSPKRQRTEAEVMADELRLMKENKIDPLQECLHEQTAKDTQSERQTTGLIVFFHGSPAEEGQCQEIAYSVGKHLKLPTISIDMCFVDALCISNTSAKEILVKVIDEMYEISRMGMRKEDAGETEVDLEEFFDTGDEFETLLKKLDVITNSKSIATPKSKVSDKKKKRSASSFVSQTLLDAMGSTTMFNLELIQDLMTDYFNQPRFNRGFVIDSLTSFIFKSPPVVLTTVLKCKSSIADIHLVLCHSTFTKWTQLFEESQKEEDLLEENVPKVYTEDEIKEIVEEFENMSYEEYEYASPELKSVYITYGLEERRKKYLLRVGTSDDNIKKDKDGKDRSARSLLPTASGDESKKKAKKEDVKVKPNSEYMAMNVKYNEYNKNVYDSLFNIANNWIVDQCDMGYPLIGLNGQVVQSSQKKIKKKSELLIQTSEESFTGRGFPLTILMCPCSESKLALINMFLNSDTVKEALKKEEMIDTLKYPIKKKEYTVLLPKSFPTIHDEESLAWRYLDELAVTSSQTSTTEIPFTSSTRISTDKSDIDVFYPLPLGKVRSTIDRDHRIILQPGDLVRCKYTFSPKVEGNFNLKRYVEVKGWPASQAVITVSGICDVPRLDSRPKKMFKDFVRRTVEDKIYKVTYLDDAKVFQFGPIFTGNHRIYEETYSIDLKNSSLITAYVEVEFLGETDVFLFDQRRLTLEPESRGKLTISAAPAEVGEHKNVLMFCVKNNPEIVTVNIACSGVVPIVEVLPSTKIIDYGKHLLYRRKDDRFIVKNDSILPVKWKIRNADDFLEDFIISQTSGIIPRYDNQVVPVTYIACRVGVITHKMLTVDIYDAEGRGDPMIVDSLYLSAECYDVMVDCAYENVAESFLNFGNVKVNSTVAREMLKKVKNFPEPALLKSFEVNPESGMLPATTKLVTVEFECTPTTSLNLVNVPVYTCTLLDGSKTQMIVAKFPICVTIASFYNTFTLFPLGELNFHVLPVGEGVKRDVILNNTSKCPFIYEIILPPEYQVDPDSAVQPKLKDNKIKNPPLRCGNFVIMNEDNLLAPSTSRVIQIQFLATAPKKFEETIHFVVSDTCPAEADGVPLRLVGTGALPILDFWNLETTFREHMIVKNLSDYPVPESSPHCVFVEDIVTLYFYGVVVNTSHTGALDLYNSGLVPCALTMKLHYQKNTNQEIFYLDKYETHIEPLMHKKLNIIFNPKALEDYRAVLEVNLKKLEGQNQSFRICVIGEGVIPRIQLVTPKVKSNRFTMLQFPVTCLGSVTCRHVSFKNISPVNATVIADIISSIDEGRPLFWLTAAPDTHFVVLDGNNDNVNVSLKIKIKPNEIVTLYVHFSPLQKGRTHCDIVLSVVNNPFEKYTILCEAEAFMEDVILMGLEMLSMDIDLETYKCSERSTVSTTDTRRRSKSSSDKKKLKFTDSKKSKKVSQASIKHSETDSFAETPVLKYLLDLGGCQLCFTQKRSIIMANNSEKVYKFIWVDCDYVIVRPSTGYISPGEEKDLEVIFYSSQPIDLEKEIVTCSLSVVSDDSLTADLREITWDNRQTMTLFNRNRDAQINERCDTIIEDQTSSIANELSGNITIVIIYSVKTEYTKYKCDLEEEKTLQDTFIYQKRSFDFIVENIGRVAMKILWNFIVDDEFPVRIKKSALRDAPTGSSESLHRTNDTDTGVVERVIEHINNDPSKMTLFSGSLSRDSVDTWFEVDLPFHIEPEKACLNPNESQIFKVTFSPQDAFLFKVRLQSTIDNLDPYDQNITCKMTARSFIPYVHLDIEESDYLTSGKRKATGALPPNTMVLEFKVLGPGCYKKSFSVINPTSQSYEFIFEVVMSEAQEFVPVHCNKLKGYVEGGTSTDVVFSFSPPAPGIYESQWKFLIPMHSLVINLLVVGFVRESNVVFVPTILLIRNSLVGFTSENVVKLKNNEDECLTFEFKGNSLCDESGETPVVIMPERGILKPHSETPINIIYTPIYDGPLSFKIFCSVKHLTKVLTLCVNALSYSIKPIVTYYLIGNEHTLKSEAVTNIHLDKTASTYERTVPFIIKNDGSATFFFEWHYSSTPVKKYLKVDIEPNIGHVAPGNQIECILHFNLKQVPVHAFPVTLSIVDGPEYEIYLHAEIEKPKYNFSCMEFDFGKCIVNAPETTYRKNIAFENSDEVPLIVDLNFSNLPELYVQYNKEYAVEPKERMKISIYFRPREVKMYEFKLQFWVNTLCEEIVTVRGEGVPLLFDLYDGCQKSFDLGPVKVGDKIVRQIEVMNHSKVPIDASFSFKDTYALVDDTNKSEATSICLGFRASVQGSDPGHDRDEMLKAYKEDKIQEQIALDVQNALSSLKVIPNKCTIQPYHKVPLKIQFKPVGIMTKLNVQLMMKVFHFERPLVQLSGSATGMSLCLSQNSLQFGRVRKRGCKILKVMLQNKGDFSARFWWQPLKTAEFTISPIEGNIAARTDVTFTVTFRPANNNPFIKVWASCNIENYKPLELALYATCIDAGAVQNKTIIMECPVREIQTEHLVVTNPTDEMWLVLSEVTGDAFTTLKEFNIEANTTFDIPIYFKPKYFGKHEGQVLYSPLGESALFINLIGIATHPNPNGNLSLIVKEKDVHTEELLVYNITEFPESYIVTSEIVKIFPDKYEGYYEIKHPDTIKVWGEATATCRWSFVCYEQCEMEAKVTFTNEETREYQFYNITITVIPSGIKGTMIFESRARESVQKELSIFNPLSTEAEFNIHCENLDSSEVIKINRNSKAPITLTYAPLVVGETEEYLQVFNPLVGVYMYKVTLICLPAKEKNLEFTTSIGSSVPLRLRVQNKTDLKAEFYITVSHPSIIIDEKYALGPLEKGKVQAWFEPTEVGCQDCRVSLNSPTAGEFVYNIKGIGTKPKPQGPYLVKRGDFTTITFKNVFMDTRTFKFSVDQEEFYLKSVYETVKPKKEFYLPVYLIQTPDDEVPTGCLTIETHEPSEPKVHWTFFLQGVP